MNVDLLFWIVFGYIVIGYIAFCWIYKNIGEKYWDEYKINIYSLYLQCLIGWPIVWPRTFIKIYKKIKNGKSS